MLGKKEYKLLNEMLDAAIAGEFQETEFDESEYSKLQTKLMRYLTNASMSERRLMEEKDNLKELITNISHQTRTPLTNILMYAELLEEQLGSGPQKDCATEIHVQANKLALLMEALVKMSRLEIGIFTFEKRKYSLQKIIQEVVNQGKGKATCKQITLQIDPGEDVEVELDPKWVVEAVYNILDNGIKYSKENTTITLSTFSYEMFAGIRIQDQGIGLDEEEIPLIFGRFYRGKAVHDKEGIGVGLYLAREILEGHNGYMKVNSKKGEGSEFMIYFPR